MKKIVLSLVSACALVLVSGAASADVKIGVMDLQQVMQKSSQIKAINDQLTKQFKPRQDKILASQKSLEDEVARLNGKGSTMSATDRSKLQDQVIADRANVQGTAVAFQRDVTAAQNEAMKGFMATLTDVVNAVAKAGNYDLILQRAGVPFVNNSMDVTAQVVQGLAAKK